MSTYGMDPVSQQSLHTNRVYTLAIDFCKDTTSLKDRLLWPSGGHYPDSHPITMSTYMFVVCSCNCGVLHFAGPEI